MPSGATVPTMSAQPEWRKAVVGGMRANAPAEVFDGVWSLTRSVLDVADVVDLSGRLGLA